MRWKKTLQVVDVHCEGEIGKVITSTTLDVPGATMLDKLVHLNTVDDSLRRMVCFEPRGFVQMTVNLLLPPTRPDADAGFIVLQPDRAHPMSGSNAMCVTTALLETGMLEMREPETVLRLDTAAGLVMVTAACKDGKVTHASINTTASFVQGLDVEVETGRFGRVRVDVPTHTGWRISSLVRSAPLPAKCRWKGGQDDHPFKTEPPAASHSPSGSYFFLA